MFGGRAVKVVGGLGWGHCMGHKHLPSKNIQNMQELPVQNSQQETLRVSQWLLHSQGLSIHFFRRHHQLLKLPIPPPLADSSPLTSLVLVTNTQDLAIETGNTCSEAFGLKSNHV